MLPIDVYSEDRYLVLFSRLGKVKKTPLSEYRSVDVDGIQDMKLADGDSVAVALLSEGRGEYLVTSDNAQTLRFSDENLRAQGRFGQGVAAMALGKNATIVSAAYLDNPAAEGLSLLVITARGIGKRVPIDQYPQKGRATAGVVTTELPEHDRVLLSMLVKDEETLLFAWYSESGEQATALNAGSIPSLPRARKGTQLLQGRVNNVLKL